MSTINALETLTKNEIMIDKLRAIAATLGGELTQYTDYGRDVYSRLTATIEVNEDGKIYPIFCHYNEHNNHDRIVFRFLFQYRDQDNKDQRLHSYLPYDQRDLEYRTICIDTKTVQAMVNAIKSKVLIKEYKQHYDNALNLYREYKAYDERQQQLKIDVCSVFGKDPAVHANPSHPNSPIDSQSNKVRVEVRSDKLMTVSVDIYSLETLKKIMALVE
jgi:hypothetical protein